MVSNRVHTVDLRKPTPTIQLGSLGVGDNDGTVVKISVLDSGSPVSLTGSVMGYMMRSDGATVTQTGSISGGAAQVSIPDNALTVAGRVLMAVRVTASSQKLTLAFFEFTAKQTQTSSIVDPGHVIPSIDDLLAQITRMEAGISRIENLSVQANTLPPGSSATASLSGSKLTLGIPRGNTGSATMAINDDSTSTESAWSSRKVSDTFVSKVDVVHQTGIAVNVAQSKIPSAAVTNALEVNKINGKVVRLPAPSGSDISYVRAVIENYFGNGGVAYGHYGMQSSWPQHSNGFCASVDYLPYGDNVNNPSSSRIVATIVAFDGSGVWHLITDISASAGMTRKLYKVTSTVS